jgi:mono/diheme cytochrome c family protein
VIRARSVLRLLVLAAPCLALPSCDASENFREPEWTLSRMLDQPRYEAYGKSELFDDGRAMRGILPGTVAREATKGSPLLLEGWEDGKYAERFPLPLTRALLERGHDGFETVCATCHGVLGDADSPVAAKMQLRKPPSLLSPEIEGFSPGRLYRVITVGYGLMPAVDYQLGVEERWAVAAYLKALERSQRVRTSELPEPVRDELLRSAP